MKTMKNYQDDMINSFKAKMGNNPFDLSAPLPKNNEEDFLSFGL